MSSLKPLLYISLAFSEFDSIAKALLCLRKMSKFVVEELGTHALSFCERLLIWQNGLSFRTQKKAWAIILSMP
jgi:hypothetical protein